MEVRRVLFRSPLPADDQRQPEDDAADEACAVAAQPGQDAFALFVFVEQIVNCHGEAAFLPPGGARGACVEGAGRGGPTLPDQPGTGPAGRGWIHATLPERRHSLDPLAGQCENGASEPAEDSVTRDTLARR